jgi:NitT/TauT family transport system permease protein
MIAFFARRRALILGILSLVALVGTWQLLVDFGFIDAFFVSTPRAVAEEFLIQYDRGTITTHVLATLHSFVLAFGLAVFVGVGLGVLASSSRDVEAGLEPFIWFKYSAPTVAFYPLFIAWLGYGTPTIVAIAFLFALTPIYANTLSGIRNVDPDLVAAARSFGARPHDIFFQVALPGSVPTVLAGLRLGAGRALTGVVVAELFGANAGLGYSIAYFAQLLQTTRMMVSIVMVILLGVLLTQILSFIEGKTEAWRLASRS